MRGYTRVAFIGKEKKKKKEKVMNFPGQQKYKQCACFMFLTRVTDAPACHFFEKEYYEKKDVRGFFWSAEVKRGTCFFFLRRGVDAPV